MKNKTKTLAALILSCSLLTVSSASAFSDVQGQDSEVIKSLQSQNIIQGITKDKFAPQGKLTTVQGIHLIVKALQLKPKQDSEPKKGAPWYSESVQIAKDNDIPVDLASNPSAELTKEQFAHILYKGIRATGNYPLIKMYIKVADESEGNPEYQGSIQNLLLSKITTLDSKLNFHPKQKITRIEAAVMTYKAIQFVNSHKENQTGEQQEVTFTSEKVNDGVNKIVLSRGMQPNPGYGIHINKIEFKDEANAVVYYELTSPKPGMMYPQVVTESKAETYISSQYKVEIEPSK
ncbi:S-layer homology domain-containing protein [Paenibacillus sp. J22TS3]|uniref:S-layer homology domain-containing protein n=1 Tax=Paenibacillus sp. J22TS3 TaxID=2807192 RepID=UPI001B29EF8E|nr:S-layer homology domain-containing protein [Paenibacillus sp. J22TS3]GIP21528.1 hypothetical protein J22TS3_18030 [Paenibacillus sp. J22TS3]